MKMIKLSRDSNESNGLIYFYVKEGIRKKTLYKRKVLEKNKKDKIENDFVLYISRVYFGFLKMSGCQAYHQPAVRYDGLLCFVAEAPHVLAHALEHFDYLF